MGKLHDIVLPHLGIIAIWGTTSGLLTYKYYADIDQIRRHYVLEKTQEAELVAQKVEDSFKEFYQGLRTISLLPGVKKIDRYGQTVDEDSKKALEQIYNNTYSNVALSEIYISPRTLEPDRMDPVTKKNEEPIISFDDFIASASARLASSKGPQDKIEEIEIFEFRTIKEQLKHFASAFPVRDKLDWVRIPAISSAPVITCDNSEFTRGDLESNNNKPRMGIMYSVPIYNNAGEFNGAVSGTIRLRVLENLIPKGNYGLVNQTFNYTGASSPSAAFSNSVLSFSKGLQNTDLIYSQIRKLKIVDAASWELWAASPNSDFESLQVVKQADLIYYSGLGASFALSLVLSWASFITRRERTLLIKEIEERKRVDVILKLEQAQVLESRNQLEVITNGFSLNLM